MCNLSIVSQILRIVVGLLLVLAAWFGPQTDILTPDQKQLWLLGWIGIIPLLSGIAAFCPLYAVFGRGHRQQKKS
jgi:hypothetical protein